jgi:hypothetical protein
VLHNLWLLLLCPGLPLAILMVWFQWYVRRRDKKKRRPFNEMTRPAGWSLQSRIEDLVTDLDLNLMMILASGGIAWAVSLGQMHPLVIVAFGTAASSFFAYRVAKLTLNISNHRLGLRGEQVVGLILDRISSDTIRVFHDLEVIEPGKKPWNIDHVVLTSAGVFAIETKTRRKPRGISPDGQQGHKVTFDGQQLIFPAPMRTDRYGLEQAQRNASWLADKLTTLNGSPIPVTPVLVLPGWWIDAKGKGPVTVLNPKGIASCISGRLSVLSAVQMRAISAQLDERCRIDLTQ